MARNKALMATTPLGYMPMHLPEEAEEGDERTKAAIMRDKQQQEKEEKLQQQRQESLARFKKREWDHGRFHALQSMRLSREQLQVKVRGALDAYGVRSNAAELRSKVEEVLPLTDPSQVFAQIPLVAIRMMQGVDPSHITKVMVELCGGGHPTLSKPAVQKGTQSLLKEVVYQTPKAADLVGGVLGALVCAGVLSLKEVATAILKAASKELGDGGKLVGNGCAWKLIGAVLQAVPQNSGQHQMSEQWKQTGLQLDAFLPSAWKDGQGKALPQKLHAMTAAYGLQMLLQRPYQGMGSAQWNLLLENIEELKQFINDNKEHLKPKPGSPATQS